MDGIECTNLGLDIQQSPFPTSNKETDQAYSFDPRACMVLILLKKVVPYMKREYGYESRVAELIPVLGSQPTDDP